MFPAKFGWNWPSDSWEEDFNKDFQWIFTFLLLSPLENDWCHHLNKSESPSPKDDLGQIWLKLAQWFWRRRFLKIFSEFLHFRYYLPLKMADCHHLYNFESPSPKDVSCQVWWKLAQWFLRRRFVKYFSTLLHFSYYLPLEMADLYHLYNFEFPSPKDVSC